MENKMITLTNEQFARFQQDYHRDNYGQRMGQSLVNQFVPVAFKVEDPEYISPYSELFYVENSRFWEIVFNYVALWE